MLKELINGISRAQSLRNPHARLERLRALRDVAVSESLSLTLSGGTEFYSSDRYDRRNRTTWDEVGIHGAPYPLAGRHDTASWPYRTLTDVERARQVSRWLCNESEHAITALELRQAYIVGRGVRYSVSAKGPDVDDTPARRARIAQRILEFSRANRWHRKQREAVKRRDRDGEVILRAFRPDKARPLVIRFEEPEHMRPPLNAGSGSTDEERWGVIYSPGDVLGEVAYYLRDERVDRFKAGYRQVWFEKANVDETSPRGWPLFSPVERNLARAETQLRNVAVVAALQASIALIRKHEHATQTEIEEFNRAERAAEETNEATGESTDIHRWKPGTVVDVGAGTTYEAPVASVDASKNMPVYEADVGVVAARAGFTGSMLTGGEVAQLQFRQGSPVQRRMEVEQAEVEDLFLEVLEEALAWDVDRGALPEEDLRDYNLQVFSPKILDPQFALQNTQRHQILHADGVISVSTYAAQEGFEFEEERRSGAAPRGDSAETSAGGVSRQLGSNTADAEDSNDMARQAGGAIGRTESGGGKVKADAKPQAESASPILIGDLTAGVALINERRSQLGLPPRPDGNVTSPELLASLRGAPRDTEAAGGEGKPGEAAEDLD